MTNKINTVPAAQSATTATMTLAQKQTATVQRAAQLGQQIYRFLVNNGQAGIDLVANNPYNLTPAQVVDAFDQFSAEGWSGWWQQAGALVEFVNSVAPNSLTPVANPANAGSAAVVSATASPAPASALAGSTNSDATASTTSAPAQ